jgi:predicted XRE-type DNA-binding protein
VARNSGSKQIVDSSGNVFRDLELNYDQKDMVKIHLASAISALIDERKLTQIQAAALLGIDQAKVSNLLRGRITGFSVERLLSFLTRLDRDVDIRITAKSKNRPARIRVEAA